MWRVIQKHGSLDLTLKDIVFSRQSHTVWVSCPNKRTEFVCRHYGSSSTWFFQIDGEDVFNIADDLLMGAGPMGTLDGQHGLFLGTQVEADNLEKFLLDRGAQRAGDYVGGGDCPECFGTGLKGGFQAACSRGCRA